MVVIFVYIYRLEYKRLKVEIRSGHKARAQIGVYIYTCTHVRINKSAYQNFQSMPRDP